MLKINMFAVIIAEVLKYTAVITAYYFVPILLNIFIAAAYKQRNVVNVPIVLSFIYKL